MLPTFDPLDDQYRWCIYCRADCWPELEDQRHSPVCPDTTGLYPVDEQLLSCRGGCGSCGSIFRAGDVYMHIEQASAGLDTVEVACIYCAALAAFGAGLQG
jgi:hypothetical protein